MAARAGAVGFGVLEEAARYAAELEEAAAQVVVVAADTAASRCRSCREQQATT
jgi:hypothetical protein